MQTNNILSAKLIDLIFDGRNKDYGAYELRNSYSKRITKALLVTLIIAGFAFGGAVLANSIKKNERSNDQNGGVIITEIKETPPPEKIPEPIKKVELPQVRTEAYVDMKIVDKEIIETPPPSIDALADAKIDLFKKDGISDVGIVGPESVGGETGIIEKKIEKVSDDPVSIVEIDAKYIGNWEKFLRQNLNGEVPVNNSAPPGTYTVMMQFVVDKEGNVSDIKPLTNHGYGMEQEAIRVLRKATKWEPGIQNGYAVKAYRRQPITFQVLEE